MKMDWYLRSLARMEKAALAIAAVGVVAVLITAGWRSALGFAGGAVISHFNFSLWKRIAAAVGEDGVNAPSDSKAVVLGLRYLLTGGAIFVIIKILNVSVLVVLGGLLVSVAAMLVELVCQLFISSDPSIE